MSETAKLLALLQRHYIKPGADLPGGVFVPEVGQNGRWGAGNRCDAIYIGFTSTSGRILIGHELKSSRADWLAELNKPGKADTWADECHEWWLVVANPDIVGAGELHPGWGLMTLGPSRTRMQIRTEAHRKDPGLHRPSWDAVRSIIARQDTLRAQAITERIKAVRTKISAESNQLVAQRVDAEIARRTKRQPDADELGRRTRPATRRDRRSARRSDRLGRPRPRTPLGGPRQDQPQRNPAHGRCRARRRQRTTRGPEPHRRLGQPRRSHPSRSRRTRLSAL